MISEQTGILLTVISTREALLLAEGQLPGYPSLVDEWKESLSDMERQLLEVYDNAVLRALEDAIEMHQQNQH
ncbi:MAG: hypothetical protein AB2552_05635 [Candidatus Thiodiazotropha endolucinida]